MQNLVEKDANKLTDDEKDFYDSYSNCDERRNCEWESSKRWPLLLMKLIRD